MIFDTNRNGFLRALGCAVLVAAAACSDDDRAIERHARAELREALAAEDADTSMRALYDEHDHALMWVSADGLTREGERLIAAIEETTRDGLDAAAYGVAQAHSEIEHVRAGDLSVSARGAALARAELALTEGFADLLHDLGTGARQPIDVQPAWRITQADTPTADFVRTALAGDPADAVRDARPSHPQYVQLAELRGELDRIRDAGGWPDVPDRRIRAGDANEAVAALRARLLASVVADERTGALQGLDDNPQFDAGLDRALRSFQKRHRLEAHGELDPPTVAALNVPVDDRIRTVELNLERWRWMPHELGERAIVVNVAGFQVHLLEHSRTVLSMNAIVGKPQWRTPVFSDTMTHMIVHPYWNVPESILTEELLPSARADEHYLVSNNYEVVGPDGQPVQDGVDLDDLDPENENGLRVRQKPGAGNALGEVKFMFPNQENVYLHDTPAKSLFHRSSRALSHGCVRVERPRELARFLIEWTGGDQDVVDAAFAEGENQRIDLPRAVPVYLAYFTVWMDENGVPEFVSDPYDLDAEMDDLLLTAPGARQALRGTPAMSAGG